MLAPLTSSERRALLTELRQAEGTYRRALEREAYATAEVHLVRVRELEARYQDRLPAIPFASCPLCQKPTYRSFDPFGLDGPWWRPGAARYAPPPCQHYCCVRGALADNGLPIHGGAEVAWVGPAVPYVIPRLLEHPSMVAVLGELAIQPGHIAYTIAYYAYPRLPIQQLPCAWPERIHTYTAALGDRGCTLPRDAWDFQLGPWIEQEKLRWCEPGSGNHRLAAREDVCPYVDLDGLQAPRVVDVAGAIALTT